MFRLVNAEVDIYKFEIPRSRSGFNYRVTFEPGGRSLLQDGNSLAQEGIGIRLDDALTSKMMLLEVE